MVQRDAEESWAARPACNRDDGALVAGEQRAIRSPETWSWRSPLTLQKPAGLLGKRRGWQSWMSPAGLIYPMPLQVSGVTRSCRANPGRLFCSLRFEPLGRGGQYRKGRAPSTPSRSPNCSL